jgi:hypothetical protein
MLMGSRADEATSFVILDRYAEAGRTFIDTSGNWPFLWSIAATTPLLSASRGATRALSAG